MIFEFGFGIGGLFIVLLALFAMSVRILREYERGVVFQLGRFWAVKGPGLILLIPVLQQMVRVDLRTVVHDVPKQDVISRDNVSVKVSAVLYFRVIDPERAIIQVANYFEATSQLAQTTLRSVLGKHELDEMLAERERLNIDIQHVLDAQTDAWGIKVANVEIKHVDLDESIIRAIARQAEAERERRAKVIHAEGELQASEKLLQAARMLAQQPEAFLDLPADAVAAEEVGVLVRRGEAVGEDDAQPAFAPGLRERLQHLPGVRREGVERRRSILVGEAHVVAFGRELDPDRGVAAAVVAVLHRVEEELLHHQVGLEALLPLDPGGTAKAFQERPGVLPLLQAARKHPGSLCDGVHRRPRQGFGIIGPLFRSSPP